VTTPEVLIIGAGIVGAACAAACAAAGWSTVVVARGICDGATAAGMGHLVVMDDSPAQFALTRSGVARWRELAPIMPAGAEYETCGTLWLAADQQQLAIAERRCRSYNDHGVRAEVVDPSRLMDLEPQLIGDLAGALLVPDDGVIYPPAATAFLLAQAQAAGARFERGVVIAVNADGVVLADGRRLSARRVVVAAGIGSPALAQGVGVRPRKGHLVITDRYPGFVRHQLVELGYLASAHGSADESVAFNVQPRHGGQLLIGSSRQFGTDDPAVEPHLIDGIIRAAQRYLPGIADLRALRCWTGFRPATADHLPLIGQSHTGVWLATGHEGLGITTAPATARLLVELMRGDQPHLPAEAFAADRFQHEVAHA
jgi:glycine/D-amino acid oxidase-like deaminating enzyme